MIQNKYFFDKVFSDKRMERYFMIHKDEQKAILHYQCNLELAESFYTCLSVYEVALRNAINREMMVWANRDDWYIKFLSIQGLNDLNKYITQANKQISGRREFSSPSKIVAELTLGFWVTLFNSEYEKVLWKDLRRAFPYMPKNMRKRKNISSPLNDFRKFRNRIFHHESICWNLDVIEEIHAEMITVMGWINKYLPMWIKPFDRVTAVIASIRKQMDW